MVKLKNTGLSVVLFTLFLAAMVGQTVSGFAVYNEERLTHGAEAVSMGQYLQSGDFWEATFENWESEFLQMGVFVLLTVWLYQKGSSESKTPNEPHPSEEDPRRHGTAPDAPWPVRRGGLVLKLYEHSLSSALILLFVGSFVGHLFGGLHKENAIELQHGRPELTLVDYLGSAQFWFESMQNWQSEFLAVFTIVVLSVFLRQRGSPQSKPVFAPHAETGER